MPASNWVALRLTTDAHYVVSCAELLRCRPGQAVVQPAAIAIFNAEPGVPLRDILSVDELARLIISCDVITRFADGTVIPSSRWDAANEQFCIQGWVRGGSINVPSVSTLLAKFRSAPWQLDETCDWFANWWHDRGHVDTFWTLYRG